MQCDAEEYLPNMSGGADITASTAQDWVDASEGHCWLQPYRFFEWAEGSIANPGDEAGNGGGDWNTTKATGLDGKVKTVILYDSSRDVPDQIRFRQVFEDNDYDFTHGDDVDDRSDSAELYCDTDVLNYDNFDFIRGVEAEATYQCVGFQVSEHPNDICLETAYTNLVENGGFESENVSGAWGLFKNSELSGWKVNWLSGNGSGPAVLEIQKSVSDWLSAEGIQHAELGTHWLEGSGPSAVRIRQNLDTIPGATYNLLYQASPRPNVNADDNILQMKVKRPNASNISDTIELGSSGVMDWGVYEYSFVASAPTTTLVFKDLGTANTLGPLLDDVQVSCEELEPSDPEGEEEEDQCIIEGYKYDEYGDPLSGWEIGLSGEFYEDYGDDEGGYVEDTYTDITDENGYYCIEEYREDRSEPGQNYEVGEVLQSGWNPIKVTVDGDERSHNTADSFFDVWVEIDLPEIGETLEVDFYNEEEEGDNDEEQCLIEGYKYDEHGDPLSGWEIGLFGEFYEYYRESEGGYVEEDYTDITDESGYYCIEEFRGQTQVRSSEEGRNYEVGEVLQNGWDPLKVVVDGEETPYNSGDSFFDIWVEIDLPEIGETLEVDFWNEDEKGSSGGGRIQPSSSSNPQVLGAETEFGECPAFTEFMKFGDYDGDGDTTEVAFLQEFLNEHMGLGLVVDGVFGKSTRTAVHAFQQLYHSDIILPWGLSGRTTGWFYKTTRIKANEIKGCYDEAFLEDPKVDFSLMDA